MLQGKAIRGETQTTHIGDVRAYLAGSICDKIATIALPL
jgi:hypothetical protein